MCTACGASSQSAAPCLTGLLKLKVFLGPEPTNPTGYNPNARRQVTGRARGAIRVLAHLLLVSCLKMTSYVTLRFPNPAIRPNDGRPLFQTVGTDDVVNQDLFRGRLRHTLRSYVVYPEELVRVVGR